MHHMFTVESQGAKLTSNVDKMASNVALMSMPFCMTVASDATLTHAANAKQDCEHYNLV